MSRRSIVIWPDSQLAGPSAHVTSFDDQLRQLADDMVETMRAAGGVGLAAIQIGVPLCVMVIEADALPLMLTNVALWPVTDRADYPPAPNYSDTVILSRSIEKDEGCLSLPGLHERVARWDRVRIRAQGLDGKEIEFEASGLQAQAIQHESEHFQGMTLADHASLVRRDSYRQRIKRLTREAKRAGKTLSEHVYGF